MARHCLKCGNELPDYDLQSAICIYCLANTDKANEVIHNKVGLNRNDVLQGLKQGKKYRRECWRYDIYICCNDDGYIQFESIIGTPAQVFEPYLHIDDFDATDWIEVI